MFGRLKPFGYYSRCDGRWEKSLGNFTRTLQIKRKAKNYIFVYRTDTLKMTTDENVIDYMLRAETAATSLKSAGETISDSLLIAMILKGPPQAQYKPFSSSDTKGQGVILQ